MKKFFCALFSLVVLCLAAFADGSVPVSAPSVSARSACLMDSVTGEILYEKNARLPLPMASTTKIMTALVILERCDPDAVVEIDPRAVGTEGSSMYLTNGEKLSVRDLLFGLLLQSANDAAAALALYVSPTLEDFSALMNQKAAELGMKDSRFLNPSGLPQPGHRSSAFDLALLMRRALKEPLFRALSGSKTYRCPSPDSSYRYLSNHNKLLWRDPRCVAGKTGYTVEAGRCLVTAAEKDGAGLIAVTLDASDDWNDHVSLFDYGFGLYSPVTLCREGELVCDIPVVGSLTESVRATNSSAFTVSLRDNSDIRTVFECPRFLYAPVCPGDADPLRVEIPVGRAVFYSGGAEIGSVWLYTVDGADYYVPPTLWERILAFFGFERH